MLKIFHSHLMQLLGEKLINEIFYKQLCVRLSCLLRNVINDEDNNCIYFLLLAVTKYIQKRDTC